ncbi:MAG: DNA methyltransferase [Anaerolineae bacterium]|nr:DNA methyltransferase [Anaerolineae bacterium]
MSVKTDQRTRRCTSARANRLWVEDRAFHDWYRFVLSFPPHLVRDYLDRFGITEGRCVLDPFCGTGTTLVECKKLGIPSAGAEGNPFAQFAAQVKVDWTPDPEGLVAHAKRVADDALAELEATGFFDDLLAGMRSIRPDRDRFLRTLSAEQERLLLKGSISSIPLHKTLVLLDHIRRHRDERYHRHELLALANVLVFAISNLHFGPEVGVGKPKEDALVVPAWLSEIDRMGDDLRLVMDRAAPAARVHLADARQLASVLQPSSIDAVITSPPYPNEKDYTRTTRLESVVLGFIHNMAELREIKKGLVRSNTRGVYKGDSDDRWVADNPEIQRLAEAIEERRLALGKDSGFERMYGRVTQLYFGGMARHLADLRHVLRPGAQLAYVVGDQASYLRIMIRTGELLAEIAQALDYELIGIDLFRTRFATGTREQLREEVVLLRWRGGG